jgi:hypothetical protein
MEMKTTLTMTAALLAFALAAPVYAETPQNVPGTSVEGNAKDKNAGALTAPEASKNTMAPRGGMSDDSAANVPGTASEGDANDQNQGSLSAPEADQSAGENPRGAGESGGAAANIPGAKADQRSSETDPSLGSEPKDKM